MNTEDSFSIDELARAAGMTARNVRAYTTKGLLPPPVRAGRASQYRTAHLRRLRDIRQLREAGLPLKLIMAAARAGEDLGPQGRLRRLADRNSGLAELPQQREVAEQLERIGLQPSIAQLVGRQIARHGAELAIDIDEAVATQATVLDVRTRGELADLSGQLTGQVVRQALLPPRG